ncbi:MAG: DUF177 domain-containing protein [Actinomycetota bacterium]|nr:DUF177 domain-containing protein [Actinomycetota bacterium]
MANSLRVNAAELLRRPGSQKSYELQPTLDELDVHDPSRFADDAVVDVSLHLEALTDGIVIDGELRVPWHGVCRRCLVPTGGVQVSEVHELYQLVVTDPEAFEIVGDQVDLADVVRELVLLDVPTTPLCRPDCAGLCLTCGANLNDEQCDCAGPPVDPRWAALDLLKPSDGDHSPN